MRRATRCFAICATTAVALFVSGRTSFGQLTFIAPPALPAGTASISGRVFASRQPIAGAKVYLSAYDHFSPNYSWPYHSPRESVTDARGRFRFERVPELALKLSVSHPRFTDAVYGQVRAGLPGTPIQLGAKQHFDADLHLTVGGTISGTFFNADGVPEGRLQVYAFRLEPIGFGGEGMMEGGEAITRDDGSYRIANLPAGRFLMMGYRIRNDFAPAPIARAPDGERRIESAAIYPDGWFAEQFQAVTLKDGEARSGVDMRLRWLAISTVEGIVRHPDGSPAIDATIKLFPTDRQAFQVAEARSHRDGRFELDRVPSGAYEVWAHLPGYGRWGSTVFRSDGRRVEQVAIELQPGASLAGRLVYSGTSTPGPITSIPPVFLSRQKISIYNNGLPGLAMSQGASEFSYASVPPGQYRFSLSTPPGWFAASQMVDGVDAMDFPLEIHGQEAKHIVFTLTDRWTEIAGTVIRASGGADPTHTVVVFAPDESYWTNGSRRVEAVRPDTNGRYQIRGLPPGEYVVALGSAEIYGVPDATILRALRTAGTRIALASGERRTVDLRSKAR